MAVSFELRFGFDAIFAAIGLSGTASVVVVVPDLVCFVVPDPVGAGAVASSPTGAVDLACFDVDADVVDVVVAVGFPDAGFVAFAVMAGADVDVVFAGLPVVVGLPAPRVVDAALVVGFPLWVGLLLIVVVGLPAVVGFPTVAGLPLLPGPANAGAAVKDAAAAMARIVAGSRIRIPPTAQQPQAECQQNRRKSRVNARLCARPGDRSVSFLQGGSLS
jgi:hypothetical protein